MLRMLELEDAMSAVGSRTDWKREVTVGTEFIIRRSDRVWSMSDAGENLLIFGLYEPTLLSAPELWMIMPQGFSRQLRRNMESAREYLQELLRDHPRLIARAADKKSVNFLQFLGMKQYAVDQYGQAIFEVRA